MNTRTQVTIDPETQRLAQERAAELGISFAEYVRRLLMRDLVKPEPGGDITAIFDLVSDGPATNIARDKDQMIAQAVWDEHRRGTGRQRTRARLKPGRRR